MKSTLSTKRLMPFIGGQVQIQGENSCLQVGNISKAEIVNQEIHFEFDWFCRCPDGPGKQVWTFDLKKTLVRNLDEYTVHDYDDRLCLSLTADTSGKKNLLLILSSDPGFLNRNDVVN